MNPNPFYLTPEEIAELDALLESIEPQYGYDLSYDDDFGYYDSTAQYNSPKDVCKHEWLDDVWFTSQVFSHCKHCKKKKEDT